MNQRPDASRVRTFFMLLVKTMYNLQRRLSYARSTGVNPFHTPYWKLIRKPQNLWPQTQLSCSPTQSEQRSIKTPIRD